MIIHITRAVRISYINYNKKERLYCLPSRGGGGMAALAKPWQKEKRRATQIERNKAIVCALLFKKWLPK
jgi:hypothetical protein